MQISSLNTDWWYASNGIDEGWVPCAYLEPIFQETSDNDEVLYDSSANWLSRNNSQELKAVHSMKNCPPLKMTEYETQSVTIDFCDTEEFSVVPHEILYDSNENSQIINSLHSITEYESQCVTINFC